MGKNLIQQKRGKGSPTYKAASHRFKAKVEYRRYDALEEKSVEGQVTDLIHCPAHSAPLMQVKFREDTIHSVAPEGIRVGDIISSGSQSELVTGNTLPLKNVPEGTFIYNIEAIPGDGGKFARASGTFAKILSSMANKVVVLLPSKKKRDFHPMCRATIGIVAGGGRPEKPFYKAGKRYHKMRARNKLYPLISGNSMNAVCHPYGGKRPSRKGKPTIAPHNAPPGRKVGKIRPRRTGVRR